MSPVPNKKTLTPDEVRVAPYFFTLLSCAKYAVNIYRQVFWLLVLPTLHAFPLRRYVGAVALCEFRPQLQRRDHTRFSRVSLFSLIG